MWLLGYDWSKSSIYDFSFYTKHKFYMDYSQRENCEMIIQNKEITFKCKDSTIMKPPHDTHVLDDIEALNFENRIIREIKMMYPKEYINAIKRGILDGISYKVEDKCIIPSNSFNPNACRLFKDIDTNITKNIVISGANLIDLVNDLYSENTYHIFEDILDHYSWLDEFFKGLNFGNSLCYKMFPDAVLPYKIRKSDVGYDITLIKLRNKYTKYGITYEYYDTGLIIVPPMFSWFSIVERSSFHKCGYSLSNKTAIIDPGYRGLLIISLIKRSEEVPDLSLPCRAVQAIYHHQVQVNHLEETSELDITDRDTGGFGST